MTEYWKTDHVRTFGQLLFVGPANSHTYTLPVKGGGSRGARGAMAPLKIFLEGPGPSKITDDPSSVMNFYSTLYI